MDHDRLARQVPLLSRRKVLALIATSLPCALVPSVAVLADRQVAQPAGPLDTQRIEEIAAAIAAALSRDANGMLDLDRNVLALARLEPTQRDFVEHVVGDLNAGINGLVYVERGHAQDLVGLGDAASASKDGPSPAAAHIDMGADGLYLFIDSAWVEQLKAHPIWAQLAVAAIAGLLHWALLALPLPAVIRGAVEWLLAQIADYFGQYLIPLLAQYTPVSVTLRMYQVDWPSEYLYAGEHTKRFAVCQRDTGCKGSYSVYLPAVQQ